MPDISIEDQIACVGRELRMRSSVYPRWIGNGKMTEAQANREINTMGAVLATLERVASEQRPGLFGGTTQEKPEGSSRATCCFCTATERTRCTYIKSFRASTLARTARIVAALRDVAGGS